ncbi:hypothetical protein ACLOJK_024015, partial [Asimina triloba]
YSDPIGYTHLIPDIITSRYPDQHSVGETISSCVTHRLYPNPADCTHLILGIVFGQSKGLHLKRPAAGTAAGGATVADRRHRDGAHPGTRSHNP